MKRQNIKMTLPHDYTLGEISAWKVWRIRNNNPYLRSVFAAATWFPDEPMKGNVQHPPQGVYAWKSKKSAIKYAVGFEPCVIGKVNLWGEVVEHKLGYRAEFAEITEIHTVLGGSKAWKKDKKEALCQRYNATSGEDLSNEERRQVRIGLMFIYSLAILMALCVTSLVYSVAHLMWIVIKG